jgi:hypothetical protein
MSVIVWLGVVSGIISILAFIFAVWVWIRSDAKIRELDGIIQTAYDITGIIRWDMQNVQAEDSATRLRNAENALGAVSALHAMVGKYATSTSNVRQTEIGILLERGVIWTIPMIYELERSRQVQEIWLVTADLEPDLSNPATGKIVANNLKDLKRYVYFCPGDMRELETKTRRLMANIGALKSAESSRVTVIPVDPARQGQVFQRGNVIIFFEQDPTWGPYHAFEEVVFTRIPERGIFWQEHTPAVAAEIQAVLKDEFQNWRAGPSA